MSGLTPTGIHILDADGQVLRHDLRDRKYGRTLARKYSGNGKRVWLIEAGSDYVRGYTDGSQDGARSGAPVAQQRPYRDATPTDEPLPTLPDLLRPGLDLVFVGRNPAELSAREGHYYSHPGNRFWDMLSESGLAGGMVNSHDDHSLLDRGIGFTDVVKRVKTDSRDISDDELKDAQSDFERRIAEASPWAVCFTDTGTFDVLFPGLRPRNTWGRMPASLAGAQLWVMPSTSGQAAKYHSKIPGVLSDLAAALRGSPAS